MFGFFECLKEQKSSLGRARPFGKGAGRAGEKKGGRGEREREKKVHVCSAEDWRGGRHTAWRSIPQYVKRKHRASLRLHRQK